MNQPITVSIPDPPAAQGDDDSSFALTLPSGRKAVMRAANGTHLIQANKMIKGVPSMAELLLAIISRTTLIDGKLLPYEAFVMLPLMDVMKLQGVMNERFLAGPKDQEDAETE